MIDIIRKIDGYRFIIIDKNKAKKDELFEEIEKNNKDIKEEVRKIVNEKSGEIFAFVKKKMIYGIYLFNIEKSDDATILKHLKTVYANGITIETRNKLYDQILQILKDSVATQEYTKVILEDQVIQVDPKMTGKDKKKAWICGFAVGLMFGWIIFDEISFGIIYGILFAPIFGELDVVVTNKRGRKKKKDDK